jgi:hypothetical protein
MIFRYFGVIHFERNVVCRHKLVAPCVGFDNDGITTDNEIKTNSRLEWPNKIFIKMCVKFKHLILKKNFDR